MNVSLTPELESLIHSKVKAGMYQTASEVIREALRLLKQRDEQQRQLRKDVMAGFAEIDRGLYTEYDAQSLGKLTKEVTARGRRRLAQMNRNPKP